MNNEEYDKLYVVATACNFEGELLINVDGIFVDRKEAEHICENFICDEKLADMYKNGYAKTKMYELHKDRTKEFSYVSMNEVMINAITNKPFEISEALSFFFDRRNFKLNNNKGEFENE